MINIRDIRNIYFIGIGGIGMSSLARYFKHHGKTVSGYDRTETVLTQRLVAEGIPVHYADDPALADKKAELIVYTPALPKDHRELNYFIAGKYPVFKRSEVLGMITGSSFNICVAGTHGKTTVTTMIAHLLRDSGFGCNAFLGGISVNYNSNFWSNERNVCVVEADEYDRSFLRLNPDIAVITAMDPDHLDIYGNAAAVEEAFIEFSERLKPGGWLVSKKGLKREGALKAGMHATYSLHDQDADIRALRIRQDKGAYIFDVTEKDWKLENVELHMGGLHNVENITAAIAVAHRLQIDDEKIRKAVLSFRGVKRRFEYILMPGRGGTNSGQCVFIDDYAHHPEELNALIGGARSVFPDRRCILVFQPHLFSRTRDFADGFAASLDRADEVVLLPIYPARELPIKGVTSEMIRERMKNPHCRLMTREEFLDWVKDHGKADCAQSVLVTAGAGDIDGLVEPVRRILEQTN